MRTNTLLLRLTDCRVALLHGLLGLVITGHYGQYFVGERERRRPIGLFQRYAHLLAILLQRAICKGLLDFGIVWRHGKNLAAERRSGAAIRLFHGSAELLAIVERNSKIALSFIELGIEFPGLLQVRRPLGKVSLPHQSVAKIVMSLRITRIQLQYLFPRRYGRLQLALCREFGCNIEKPV